VHDTRQKRRPWTVVTEDVCICVASSLFNLLAALSLSSSLITITRRRRVVASVVRYPTSGPVSAGMGDRLWAGYHHGT